MKYFRVVCMLHCSIYKRRTLISIIKEIAFIDIYLQFPQSLDPVFFNYHFSMQYTVNSRKFYE